MNARPKKSPRNCHSNDFEEKLLQQLKSVREIGHLFCRDSKPISIVFQIVFLAPRLGKRKGGEHRRGEDSETFLERNWVLRRFPGAS